ncbi:FAD-dependent oxidoreductase, partial [Achromobacter xylosoxidans]
VTLLEARRIAWGASGRNGGSVSPAFSAGADAIRRHVDEDHYRQLYRLSMEGVEIIRDNIRDLRIADA